MEEINVLPMHLRILSFNIWDLPLWHVKHRTARIERIAAHLTSLNLDIVCLQESFDIAHRKLLHEALGPGYHMTDGGKARGIFFTNLDTTGGLVTFSRFPIRQYRFTPFNRLTNVGLPEFFARKGFLAAALETPAGPLHVVNTHLHSASFLFGDSRVRRRQLRAILRTVHRRGRGTPAIVAGDLNEHNLGAGEAFTSLLAQFQFTHPAPSVLRPTYRPENDYVEASWINRVAMPLRLDYFLVRAVEEYGLGVARYEPLHLQPPLSDHDPVLLVLES